MSKLGLEWIEFVLGLSFSMCPSFVVMSSWLFSHATKVIFLRPLRYQVWEIKFYSFPCGNYILGFGALEWSLWIIPGVRYIVYPSCEVRKQFSLSLFLLWFGSWWQRQLRCRGDEDWLRVRSPDPRSWCACSSVKWGQYYLLHRVEVRIKWEKCSWKTFIIDTSCSYISCLSVQ